MKSKWMRKKNKTKINRREKLKSTNVPIEYNYW